MKKLIIFVLLGTFTVFSACKKENSDNTKEDKVSGKELVSIVFQQALFYDSAKKSPAGTEPFSFDIDFFYNNPDGGTVSLDGLYSGNIITDDYTHMPISMVYDLNFTETFTNWAFTHEYVNYTMTTLPGLQFTGHADYNYAGNLFANYSQNIEGSITITGPDNYTQTNTLDITITLFPQGNGGTVTGTIDGEAVSFSVP